MMTMNDDTLSFGWSEHRRSDRDDAEQVRVETSLEIEKNVAERILYGLATGVYDNYSENGVREKLKKDASKVEIEKIHYTSE